MLKIQLEILMMMNDKCSKQKKTITTGTTHRCFVFQLRSKQLSFVRDSGGFDQASKFCPMI